MKVAVYQAPLLAADFTDTIERIRTHCSVVPERTRFNPVLSGGYSGRFADYSQDPIRIAISAEAGVLAAIFAPLASETVTTIVGFYGVGERTALQLGRDPSSRVHCRRVQKAASCDPAISV